MTVEIVERNRIAELAETAEIKEQRKFWKEDNESSYAEKGIKSFAYVLSGVCGKNIYLENEVSVYFEILDMRDFLKEKYAELSETDVAKYKKDVEIVLNEADEVLISLYEEINSHEFV